MFGIYHIWNVSCSTRTGEQIVKNHFAQCNNSCYSRPKGTTVLNVLYILNVYSGAEPAILVWYGHCNDKEQCISNNKLGESGDMLPQEKFSVKLGTLRVLLRPCLGQNAMLQNLSTCSFCSW